MGLENWMRIAHIFNVFTIAEVITLVLYLIFIKTVVVKGYGVLLELH